MNFVQGDLFLALYVAELSLQGDLYVAMQGDLFLPDPFQGNLIVSSLSLYRVTCSRQGDSLQGNLFLDDLSTG